MNAGASSPSKGYSASTTKTGSEFTPHASARRDHNVMIALNIVFTFKLPATNLK